MNAGLIQLSLDEVAKKLGLPEAVTIVGCEIDIARSNTILFALRGPGLPEVSGRHGEVLQVVNMVTETRFE